MDVNYDGALLRPITDLDNLSYFSDVVDNAYLGYDYDAQAFGYPLVLHFDGDLTDAEVKAVLERLSTIPNEETVRKAARNAVATNNNYLAIASPTNADVLAQVRFLTRECNGFIKLLLRGDQLSNTNGI